MVEQDRTRNSSITRPEWLWVLLVACLIVIISSLPYIAGYLSQTDTLEFGGAVLDRSDYHSYLARMWLGYRGQWEYNLLFTPEDHTGAYSQPLYIALGHLARILGLQLHLVHQIARVTFSTLMLLAAYRFIALFIPAVSTRRVAFLLAVTASGLGWLTESISATPPGGISPMDFWLLDAYTYLAVLHPAHFSAAMGLLFSILTILLRRPTGPSPAEGVLAVLASIALGIIHPYALLLVDLLPALYWAVGWVRTRHVPWRGLVTLIAMGVTQMPLVFYSLWLFTSHPIFAGWTEQNITHSPPPHIYLLGYGSLMILAALGLVRRESRERNGTTLPMIWIVLVAILIYLPWNLQRRFLEGVQIPLGMLAGIGLVEVLLPGGDGVQARRRRLGRVAIIGLLALSNLVLTAALSMAATNHAPDMFWPRDLLTCVDWLGENSEWHETVLAGPETGGLIPARIGHRVVVGHVMETVEYDVKLEDVMRFFAQDTSDQDRITLVTEWNVAYLLYGTEEHSLGEFDPDSAPWLTLVFHSGETSVYRVDLSD